MKLIERKLRDIVLKVMECENDSKQRIMCDLNGLDYDFAKDYYPIAKFESEFLSDNRYCLESIEAIYRRNKIKSIKFRCFDFVAQEELEWNSSFGSKYASSSNPIHVEIEIPIRLFSEWTVDIVKTLFDIDRV